MTRLGSSPELPFRRQDFSAARERLTPIPVAVEAPADFSREQVEELGRLEKIGCNLLEAEFCVRRGIAGAELFLQAPRIEMMLGYQIPGVQRTIDLVKRERSAGRPVFIAGDYDVDGVMSSTIFLETLRAVGLKGINDAPCRQTEGYGLNKRMIDEARKQGCRLLIATDFGSAQVEMVEYAKWYGIDVVIVDHHHIIPHKIPEPAAFINPKFRGEAFSNLCAAGLAYRFACELAEALPECRIPLEKLAAYAAVATVADVVPLVDDNRYLVRHGTSFIGREGNLAVLMQEAGIPLDGLGSADIAFKIGPIFNAPGRIVPHGASECLEFLRGDVENPVAAAQSLLVWNRQRREREKHDFRIAINMLMEQSLPLARGIVLASKEFDPGVAGLVSSRLTERFHRPSAVIAWSERGGGRGSVRAGEKFNVYDALHHSREHLVHYGGHRAAGGLTIRKQRLAAFEESFVAEAERQLGAFQPRRVKSDFCGTLGVLENNGQNILDALRRCEPYGEGNKPPVFYVPDVRIDAVHEIGTEHLVLDLEDEGAHMRCYAWRGQEGQIQHMRGQRVSLGCTMSMFLNNAAGRATRDLVLELVGIGRN